LGWAATAAVIVFAASLRKENTALKQGLASASAQARRARANWRRSAPDCGAHHCTGGAARHAGRGENSTAATGQGILFAQSQQPAVCGEQHARSLWLIPAQGAPISAGVFKPDAHGSATVVNPPLPAGMEAKAFAITVENEAGATRPTLPIVMMGTGE
jgi:hypothetical protein